MAHIPIKHAQFYHPEFQIKKTGIPDFQHHEYKNLKLRPEILFHPEIDGELSLQVQSLRKE